MSLATASILQSILDGETHGIGGLTVAVLRNEALARGMRPRPRDRDGAEGGDANAAPVPKDRQARAEGIAQNPTGSTS